MTASIVLGQEDAGTPRIGLGEWLRLRRHPMPEFYDSLRALPPGLLSVAQPMLPSDQAVRGALVLPPEYFARKRVHWEYVPERALVFLDSGALFVAGPDRDKPPQAMLLDARTLLYVRSSLLLLYGLLEFEADCGSEAGEVRLEYNTVIWQSLRWPLTRLVTAACPRAPAVSEAEALACNAPIIRSLPFKFANGMRYYGLDAGELLEAAVFQPAIWQRRSIFPQQVTPNTLFALTDRKLVLIEEQRTSAWQRKRSDIEYGWIFTYIPRDRVVDMGVTAGAEWTELRLRLEWGGAKEERTFLLEPQVASQWHEAWQAALAH